MSALGRARRLVGGSAPAAPPEAGFDEAAYLAANPDVAAAVASGAMASGWAHYQAFGEREGRPLSGGPVDRVERVLATIDRDGKGLEVGPSHSPMAPKAAGFDVDVMDHLDTETLRAHFAGKNHAIAPNGASLIEEVDFVWKGQPLPELIGGEDVYDWIICSHSIEHIPDLVAFFQGCQAILKPGGRLALVVPDYRYCFDHYGVATTAGALLDAHHEGRTMPSVGQVYDYLSRCASLHGDIAWAKGVPDEPDFLYDRAMAIRGWTDASAGADLSGDLHCWRFTPETFRVILDDLVGLGLVDLRIVAEHPTHGAEFWVTLEVGGEAATDAERLEMLRAARRSMAD
jgi:SAM-dependent methyltransferase